MDEDRRQLRLLSQRDGSFTWSGPNIATLRHILLALGLDPATVNELIHDPAYISGIPIDQASRRVTINTWQLPALSDAVAYVRESCSSESRGSADHIDSRIAMGEGLPAYIRLELPEQVNWNLAYYTAGGSLHGSVTAAALVEYRRNNPRMTASREFEYFRAALIEAMSNGNDQLPRAVVQRFPDQVHRAWGTTEGITAAMISDYLHSRWISGQYSESSEELIDP